MSPSGFRRLLAVLATAAALGTPLAPAHRLAAQTTATFDLAVYVPQPLAIAATRHLSFGTVWPGTPKTIATTDVATPPGLFTVTGSACAEVLVMLTPPAGALISGGGATMPIDTWTMDWAGGLSPTFAAIATPESWTTLQLDRTTTTCVGTSGSYVESESGQLKLRVGATVRPDVAQAVGTYSNTVTLEVMYVDR